MAIGANEKFISIAVRICLRGISFISLPGTVPDRKETKTPTDSTEQKPYETHPGGDVVRHPPRANPLPNQEEFSWTHHSTACRRMA